MTELAPTKPVPDPSESAGHLFPPEHVPPPPTIAPDTERKEETSKTNAPVLHAHKTCSDMMYDKVLPLVRNTHPLCTGPDWINLLHTSQGFLIPTMPTT